MPVLAAARVSCRRWSSLPGGAFAAGCARSFAVGAAYARWSELRRIRARDYDSNAGTVLIARTKRKKARHVYLTQEGRNAFDEWTSGLGREVPVFTQADGEQWGSHNQHRPMAFGAASLCGVDAVIQPISGG